MDTRLRQIQTRDRRFPIPMCAKKEMQKYHQNDIRRTIPEGLRPTAQRKGRTNEKTQAKYSGTGVRQSDPVLCLRKIGVLGKAGAHKVMLMAAIAFNLKNTSKMVGGSPPLNFNDYYKCFTRLHDCFLQANPTDTSSHKGPVKTTC